MTYCGDLSIRRALGPPLLDGTTHSSIKVICESFHGGDALPASGGTTEIIALELRLAVVRGNEGLGRDGSQVHSSPSKVDLGVIIVEGP